MQISAQSITQSDSENCLTITVQTIDNNYRMAFSTDNKEIADFKIAKDNRFYDSLFYLLKKV